MILNFATFMNSNKTYYCHTQEIIYDLNTYKP